VHTLTTPLPTTTSASAFYHLEEDILLFAEASSTAFLVELVGDILSQPPSPHFLAQCCAVCPSLTILPSRRPIPSLPLPTPLPPYSQPRIQHSLKLLNP